MSSIDDFYVNRIHILRTNEQIPSYVMSKPTSLARFKHDEAFIALLLMVTRNPTQREITHRQSIPLREVLQNVPTRLRNGMISQMMLEGNELPAFVIHTDISEESLSLFATAVLGRIAIEKNRKRGFGLFKLFYTKKARDTVEEAREQAKKVILAGSEPVANYIK